MRYERSRPRWNEVAATELVSGRSVTAARDGAVAVVTLDRPQRRNALDGAALRELTDVLGSCDADEDVRVIVLTGSGPTFCAGVDLGDGDFGVDPALDEIDWVAPCHLRKPVIAAVNGHAVGAGLTLALQCDLRIVAENARLGLPFVRLGVTAEWSGHWTAVHLLGLGRAAELLLTGELIDGRRAEQWGLANRCLPADQVLPAAVELATRMARDTAPAAVAVSKRLMWSAAEQSLTRHAATEHAALDALLDGPDAAEGVRAFLDKRTPRWSGRLDADLPPWTAGEEV